jgi:hypothetical protein
VSTPKEQALGEDEGVDDRCGDRHERASQTIFFKIDFDNALASHSPDRTDPSVTERVITIMLAEEY